MHYREIGLKTPKRPPTLNLLMHLLTLLLLFIPETAGATQIHPAEEGFFVHQIGHVLFVISMGVLVYWLRERGLTRIKGWRRIQYSAVFFVLWNLDALFVHFLDQKTEGIFETVSTGGWSQWIRPVGDNYVLTLLYYFGRMDHFFCVPAIVLLYFGLKDLLNQSGPADAREGPS